MQLISWPRYPQLDIKYFEELLQKNAQELMFARHLAETVSLLTRRPVLTLHNASMGAPSGWGIADFSNQWKELSSWKEEIAHLWPQFSSTLSEEIIPLIKLWLHRLIEMPLIEYLWQMKVLNSPFYSLARETVKDILSPSAWQILAGKESVPWESTAEELFKHLLYLKHRYFQEKYRLKLFLPLLITILKASVNFLQKGARFCVVPYIDKLIRSSYGDKDITYCQTFLKFILRFVPEAIILFFDETTHPRGPTLKLAISVMKRKNLPIKGLGVYGEGKLPTPEDIANLSSTYQVFFVSAFTGKGKPYCWREILLTYPQTYHPAWRDGLTELFSGTQMAFLTQEERQDIILTDKGPMQLGTYFRLKLKTYSLTPLSHDPFWCFYETLANLG
ncbi:MAG: hypothetical protein J7M03_02770 [Candidatus Desulfofervidaceae bacterium]|nr:hypothetical protein [Candidatus Desulfofervidaceae bacterium]